MYELREIGSIEEHTEDLVFLEGALEALKEEEGGALPDGLDERMAEVSALIVEGDALAQQIREAKRTGRKTSARIRRADSRQEHAVIKLHADCMHAATQDKHDARVKTLFEGGVSRVLQPALSSQNETVRAMIGALSKQDIYEGALRDEHAPKLQETVNDADALLKRRVDGAQDLEALYARANAWKQRGNTLRAAIGGQLMALAADRKLPSPKDWARGFFGRGQE